MESATLLAIADAPEQGHGRPLSLDGRWLRRRFQIINDGPLWIETEEPIVGGMSGSPIISDDVAAIGVNCLADISDDPVGASNTLRLSDLENTRYVFDSRPRLMSLMMNANLPKNLQRNGWVL